MTQTDVRSGTGAGLGVPVGVQVPYATARGTEVVYHRSSPHRERAVGYCNRVNGGGDWQRRAAANASSLLSLSCVSSPGSLLAGRTSSIMSSSLSASWVSSFTFTINSKQRRRPRQRTLTFAKKSPTMTFLMSLRKKSKADGWSSGHAPHSGRRQ
jgi:hypothetical protein